VSAADADVWEGMNCLRIRCAGAYVVKPMVPVENSNPYWLGGLVVTKDSSGRDRLLANYSKIEPPLASAARGLVEFDDDEKVFEIIREDTPEIVFSSSGHVFNLVDEDIEYIYYFGATLMRARNDYQTLINRAAYESFTCLKEGSRFECNEDLIERDADGKLVYSWKKDTSPVGNDEQKELVKEGLINADKRWIQFFDAESGDEVVRHGSCTYWNPYRQRWVMVLSQLFGTSCLGELWYAEADTPLGPWAYATKILTHDTYSFYNPVQHPHFAKENGRKIFFEGTYTKQFSGNEIGTPRYDYNQIMYMLELDDARLFLPVPIYRTADPNHMYLPGNRIPKEITDREVAFLAPDRQMEETIPVYRILDDNSGQLRLTTEDSERTGSIAFYALPLGTGDAPVTTEILYEIADKQGVSYATESALGDANVMTKTPVCVVWKNPTSFNPYRQ